MLGNKKHGFNCSFCLRSPPYSSLFSRLSFIFYFLLHDQEVNGGKKPESIGRVTVDLAEYTGSKFSTRLYLLQQSKMNSSLKVSLNRDVTSVTII